jgi:hypothetical protein
MSIIICTQDDILPDECPECGGWLHTEIPGGVAGPFEWRFCSEDCAASCQDHANTIDRCHPSVWSGGWYASTTRGRWCETGFKEGLL